MKAYLIVTGIMFALATFADVVKGPRSTTYTIRDITSSLVIQVVMCAWATWLLFA